MQRLKTLHQKEKATKSSQDHISVSITDVVTGCDISKVSSEVAYTVDTQLYVP